MTKQPRVPHLIRPLGSPSIAVGVYSEPMPQVGLAFTWPELPDRGIDVRLTLQDARNLIDGLTESADIVEGMLDELG
jgi:hypothetical protein